MSWERWPFHPRSLTEMVGPDPNGEDNERFVSLVLSGCSERLRRPLVIIEPAIDQDGQMIEENDPSRPGNPRPKLRRIEPVNPRAHFTEFCRSLRESKEQDVACQLFDISKAHELIASVQRNDPRTEPKCVSYECRAAMTDLACVINYNSDPVGVVMTGQFGPDIAETPDKVRCQLNKLVACKAISREKRDMLLQLAAEVETRDKFAKHQSDEAVTTTGQRLSKPNLQTKSFDTLFLEAVNEIRRITCDGFQMRKKEKEGEFLNSVRDKLLSFVPDRSVRVQIDRDELRKGIESVLHLVREYCGTEYLALFISSKKFISYEGNTNLLPLFAVSGLGSETVDGIKHFNWRRGMRRRDVSELHAPTTSPSADVPQNEAAGLVLTRASDVGQVLTSGLKGEHISKLFNASLVFSQEMSENYRAVLVWGPFSSLSRHALEQEVSWLRDLSDLIVTRVLSLTQLSDSEEQTEVWSDVASLLAHHSRRAMNPVSTGVAIIQEYLKEGMTYSKLDAIQACESLTVAARVIARAVRVPIFSFAAMVEQVYKFAPVPIERIVSDCVRLYRPVAHEKGIRIVVDQSVARLPCVEADEGKLRDAIGYVLDNAVKYSHSGKEVRIFASSTSTHAVLTIEDFGQGIDPEDDLRIYDRGHQGIRSKKSAGEEGEGLGLFHARLILQAHKGQIVHGCRSGPRTPDSARLEGYAVWFRFEIPIKQDSLSSAPSYPQ